MADFKKQFVKNGMAFTRLPIRFRITENNIPLAKFIFELYGSDFIVSVFGSSTHISRGCIEAAIEYYNDSVEAFDNTGARAFSDGFFPKFEVLSRMQDGGDLIRIKDCESLNYFLSTGDSESSVSIFPGEFDLYYLEQFFTKYLECKLDRIDSKNKKSRLYYEEYVSDFCLNHFENKIVLLDTINADEDYDNYLLICPESVPNDMDLRSVIDSTDWPVMLANRIVKTIRGSSEV